MKKESRGASYIIPRFVQYAGKPHGTEPDGKKGHLRARFPDGGRSSLYYHSHGGVITEIVSYGSHFPLGRLILNEDGSRKLWVLNGDWWGRGGFGRTNNHNAMMREAAQQSGTPWVIVPFSALREAGISMETIVPVEVLPERWTREDHSAITLDGVPESHRKQHTWRDATGAVITPPVADDGRKAYPDSAIGGGSGWHVSRHSALNGHQNFPVPGPEYQAPLEDHYQEITPGADGLYHWTEQRHWLGESVFRASYTRYLGRDQGHETRRHAYFLSAFDTNEPRPLYFLAELPRGARPQTVAAAREALKPPEVLAAEAAGRAVLRQGDVFAIARPGMMTRDLPGPSQRMTLVLQVNHRVTEMRMLNGRTYARGRLYHVRRPAEHATIQLGDGKTWHELVRNTVPMHQAGNFPPSVRAWSMGGRVD